MAGDPGGARTGAGHGTGAAPSRAPLAVRLADGVDRAVAALCRLVVLVTGIALTLVLTANVLARYLAGGGFRWASEVPERVFPWFVVAGIVLAAQAGGHMSVEWLPGKLDPRGRRLLMLGGNAIVVVAYAVLMRESLRLAAIAGVERSPILGLSGSHGYWAMAAGLGLVALVTLAASVRVAVLGPERAHRATFKET